MSTILAASGGFWELVYVFCLTKLMLRAGVVGLLKGISLLGLVVLAFSVVYYCTIFYFVFYYSFLKNEQKNLRLSPPILQGEILSGEDLLLGANPRNSL